ncbi:origin recognition complex subunit 2-domain-containing protein [Melanogaster broomeanus]|nr:origin recognition complex subunit 2-domain-containing protein [Melanogaster broomeanus]
MDSDDASDGDISENEQTSRLSATNDQPSIQPTRSSFDAYFLHNSSRSRTSANVFSSHVLPLTPDDIDTRTAFRRYARELEQGFNLLFYGFGSKRAVLNAFASECLAKRGHVVVVNGFHPNTTLKDIIASVERVPGVADAPLTSSSADAQIQRIFDFFASDAERSHHLYLIIHNIDAPPMRTPKIRNCLSLLALNPNIHLVASIDRLNAPLLWSSSELLARKVFDPATPKRGYAFLWHDLTTLASYDTELAVRRPLVHRRRLVRIDRIPRRTGVSRRPKRGRQRWAAHGERDHPRPRRRHLESQKALYPARREAAGKNMDAAAAESTTNANENANANTSSVDAAQYGLTYDALFSLVRDQFGLLGEFRDHGLILAGAAGGTGGETLWIPLRKERLVKVLKAIEAES